MHQFQLRALATVAVAAFALAACGSSSKTSSPSASTTSAPGTTIAPSTTIAPDTTTTAAPAAAATVTVATSKLGKILVDAKGMTLYRFDADTVAGKSACGAGPCASNWPAATVTGAVTPGAGVTGALSTFKRDDGSTQLQIAGHPLYTFAGDAKPGDTNGQGIINQWHVVSPSGDKIG